MKKVEIYGLSKPQDGRKTNEDSFLIIRGETPVVVLCDGAGNAEQAAKKTIKLFHSMLLKATPDDFMSFQKWKTWVNQLDSSLLGGHQTTFTALVVLENRIVGVNVGDNRVYRFGSDGKVTILTHSASKKRLGSGEIQPFPIHEQMQSKEIISVMSDGAWGPLSIQKVTSLFRQRLKIHQADLPEKFLQEAGRYGRCDDMTVVNIYF